MTIIIVGKTGSGKSKTAKKLESKYGFRIIVTDTTRPIRDNEVDGIDYLPFYICVSSSLTGKVSKSTN